MSEELLFEKPTSVSIMKRYERQKSDGFEPFSKANSSSHNRRHELYLFQGPKGRRIWVKVRNYDTHREIGMSISQERWLKVCSDSFRVLVGGISMPLEKKTLDRFLEFYFKPRRKTGVGQRYVHRAIIHDLLDKKKIYAAQVTARYGLTPLRSAVVLRDMEKAGILRVKEKLGRMTIYVLAIDEKDVTNLVHSLVGFMNLKGELKDES